MPEYQLPPISFSRLRFHLIALENCTLPSWKGSLLRGAFGHALRRTVCTMKKGQPCEDCMLRAQCAYTRLFETSVTGTPPRFLRGLKSSPRPFIFEPFDTNKTYQQRDTLYFDLILIGKAAEFLPYVVFAIYQVAQTGLGVNRHKFLLNAAYCTQNEVENPDKWRLLYEGETQRMLFNPGSLELKNSSNLSGAPYSVKLKFLTQTRLKFKNKLGMDFTFRMLVFKMLRRVLELAYFYASETDINWEFHDLLAAADDVKITRRNLTWEDQGRYSNRQKTKMQMGGFVGDITLSGDLAPFMDLLKYCEVLHVGKGATFGLGRIKLLKS